MSVTLTAAYIALQIGPFVALAFALPYVLYVYISTKSVDVLKCAYFYSFCLYFLCAYFVTWLPLPTEETLAGLKPVPEFIQLVPFQSFMDIEMKTIFRDLAIIIFNVILTVPLGWFLRNLFGFSLKKTVLWGFLVSLLYELTQLTGLFFIYPRPYRIFDVDDLIINTLGAYIGYIVAPYASKLLPRLSDNKALRLQQGSEVVFWHRAAATGIDLALIFALTVQLISFTPVLHELLAVRATLMRFPLFFALFISVAAVYSFALGRNMPGYKLTRLELMTAYGKRASRARYVCRTLLLYVCVFGVPFWVMFFMSIYTEYVGPKSLLWMLISALLMMCAARNVLEIMFNAVTNGSSMFYDRRVKTYVAYSSTSTKPIFGIHVIDILPLCTENIDILSQKLCDAMASEGITGKSITKIRLMVELLLLEWKSAGLDNTVCELRMDTRRRRRSIILSVPGDNKTQHSFSDESEIISDNMRLRLDTYYAAEKNICIIHIP